MRANRGCLIGICLLLLFCQLPKSDARKKKHASAAWSEWKEGECSRSCGGGVRTASRTCMNNRSDGRFHCKGESTRYTSCNTQECPDKLDFRAVQCSKFNDNQKKWKPFYGDGADACALICAVNRTYHIKLADKVVDGTRCRPDGYDVCIDGVCKKAGCDRVLGSEKEDDACGHCGGGGKDCKTVKGSYEHEEYEGYKDIITILKGARNIHIYESRDTQNYFAVRNFFGTFYLNSEWKLAPHKKFVAAGAVFRYQKDSNGQVLMARGPTTEALTLVLVGKGDFAKVHYEYYIPEVGQSSKSWERKQMRRPKNKHMLKETGSPRHSQEQPKSKTSLTKTRADRPSKPRKPMTRRRAARDDVHPSADTPQPSGDAPPGWDPRRAASNYQWQYGGWSECSGACGEEGVQRRAVQCYDMSARVLAKGLCNDEGRPSDVQKCEKTCEGGSFRWMDAGWTECSKSCGGGEMSTIAICEKLTKSGRTPVEEKHCLDQIGASPQEMKVCNEQPCADSPVPTESPCWETLYGCCPDRRTAASGPDNAGCAERRDGCHYSNYGCCPDGATPARGPDYYGCRVDCQATDYGCCPDGATPARGPNYHGCRVGCQESEYGCCPDGATPSRGPRYAGCPSVVTNREQPAPTAHSITTDKHVCHMEEDTGTCSTYAIKWAYNATSGRCSQFWYGGCGGNDNRFEDERACLMACRGERIEHNRPRPTVDSPRKEVAGTVPSETRPRPDSGNLCELKAETGSCSEFETKWAYNATSGRCEQFWYGGCGGNDNRFDTDRDCQVKCRQRTASGCSSTPFGCCEDGVTAARGRQRLGCPRSDCRSSRYGCCPDGVTASRGQEHEGCGTRDCNVARYGCCQDGTSFARGENYEGCPQQGCGESPYGCCPDGVTSARGENYAGCRGVNECERTEYGCCPDKKTTAQGPNGEGCCHYTEFGCCPDGLTISGPNHESCRTQDCRRSRYGCCRDGVNFARGENFRGCPSTDCRNSAAGCCPDGVTFVSEGCAPPDCHATSFGCCPDGQTIARGYFHEGCAEKDCRESRYGCCPDGVSYAKGEDYGGCPTCRETKYGCCPDGITVARGDGYLGCTQGSCHSLDYGCCPDMRTAAQGPEHLGCKDKNCQQYRYGCCDDGVTYARGRNMDGCPKRVEGCSSTQYGCCEDRRTAAQGPDRYGCPETRCEYSEFGCCEDGVTFARGRDKEGCPRRVGGCAGTRHGCCEDGRTAAEGPDRYGCPETRCEYSEFGCCEDGVTFARGRDKEGCPRRVGGCAGTRHGCCEDGRTAAEGPDRYGCPETRCEYSEFGCCEDGVTFARGRDKEGCPRRVGGCAGTRHGCCEDGRTAAEGPDRYGCPETRCEYSEFGCCEDGVTFARGRDKEGCPRRVGGCAGTRHGCCEDGRTAAEGPDRYGCPETRCEYSEFGCCEDGVTFARGRDKEGCPRRVGGCAGTRHGCCEDGRTAAQGPDRYGCPETRCEYSEYGCCEDGVTFARGRDKEGCPRRVGGCAGTRHGCCEDGRTAAEGPDRYGCPENRCDLSEHGCCPDGTTPARGPDHEGCRRRDCNRSRYGCCPDGVSFARGQNYGGCQIDLGCEASAYGCCPDSVTAARGPQYAGCPPGGCRATRYGCCPDETTSADGPNYAGCEVRTDCSSTRYGCCPDRQTVARGPDFAGCVVPSPTPSSEVDCESDSDTGSCVEYVTKWFFNKTDSRCQQFWYGGCGGNNNRFETERECDRKCRRRRGSLTTAAPLDLCRLPYEEGSCSSSSSSNEVRRWYYEESSHSCQMFWYSGCDGNENNFESESACVQRCFHHVPTVTVTVAPTEPSLSRDALEICHLELQAGVCSKEQIMWHYDKQDGLCKNFTYTGCYGNSNRFPSKESCEAMCSREAVCNFKEAYGTCQSNIQRYRYDAERGECVAFSYSGCNGNANNFVTQDACRAKCGVPIATTTPHPVEPKKVSGLAACSLEKDESVCPDGVQRTQIAWYYDLTLAVCQQFNYSGCGGNNNRFDSAEECTRTCNPRDVCQMPSESGLCLAYSEFWYFNKDSKKCELFAYGGCGGNANRFATRSTCKRTCRALMADPIGKPTFTPEIPPQRKTKDSCVLRQKPGTCNSSVNEIAWFYNMTEGICQLFDGRVCSYNDNKFSSRRECESVCDPRELCVLPKDSGTCYVYSDQYYFNPTTKRCEAFVYRGCGGNANRFPSIGYCEKACNALMERNITTGPEKLPDGLKIAIMMCHLQPEKGPCRSNKPMWYYEVKEARCRQFTYGGCQGNQNRFTTRGECENTCSPQVICSFSRDTGNCTAYHRGYYFNSAIGRCEHLSYGDCNGNANRFFSADLCQRTCKGSIRPEVTTPFRPMITTPRIEPTRMPTAEDCHLEKDSGSCRAQISAWHYDSLDNTCKQFYYGGCEGNANRFQSRRECERTCNAHDICNLPQDSGICLALSLQFYYNRHSRRCEQFDYGGCGGNANRFPTLAKCHIVCRDLIEKPTTPRTIDIPKKDQKPVAFCHLDKKPGTCEAQIASWHYDIGERTCKPFNYGGCEGNENRFESKEQCESICNPHDICNLPKEAGICYAYSNQFYFNPQTGRCEEFVYGGCGGNANRFVSLAKCQASCHSRIEHPTTPSTAFTSPAEACHLEKDVGPCRGQLPVWHYDAADHQCKQFRYGGCQGNANKFETAQECQHTCNPQSICNLPKESRRCYDYSAQQYYFNSRTKRCEQFVYGECGGNANRFASADKCMDVCRSLMQPDIVRTTPKAPVNPAEACHLEKKVGPCRAQLPAWHYDPVEHKCRPFGFGGCQGNANNFETSYECHRTCNSEIICNLPKESRRCYDYSAQQYYFNSRTKRCEQFVYGECGGNANRFASADKCMDVCRSLMQPEIPETTPQPHVNPALCQLPQDSGNCFNYSEIYYFDQNTNRCEQFVYNGCGGNANRFQSLTECRRVCRSVAGTKKPDTKIDVPDAPKRNKEVCRLQKLIGPCSYNVTAWYFDERYGVCSMFTYSGCGGNKNNFKTLEDCEHICQPTNDVCNHPMETKQCLSSRSFWIYDSAAKTCSFIPTGHCEDNPHHFSSESDCQKQCLHQETPKDNVCHFRMEEGPCRDYTRAWYYNMEEAICKPFIYGGCDGNKNRFDTQLKCERMCNKHAICNLKKDAGICYGYGDAYYFNSEKTQCEHFVYGGCGGNANRFTSLNQCHNVCGGSIANDTHHEPDRKEPGKCQLQPDPGHCKERNIFWYYDHKTGFCSRFYFTGCGGNDNKFATEEDCLTSCKSPLPMTTTYAPVTDTSHGGNPKNRFTTIHVAPKQTLTLHCGELIDSTKGGSPVTWTHEGKDIVPDVRRKINNLDLLVYDVTNKDAGMYSCREKSNTEKPTLDKFKVVIKVPVTIEYGPSHIPALLTHRLAIPCKAHGVPKPLITWYKDGKQLYNDDHFRILDNGTLVINPFTTYDAAMYKCLARNGYEGKAEKDVKVTIQDSLNLKIKKSSENNHVGDKITLTCTAEGYPNTRLQWFYKDRELYSNRHITVRDGVLTINNATYDDSGIYTCRGIHGSDKVDKDESLRIKSRPDEVPNVCEDKLPVNRCRMIVAAKLCKRKTFHKNCCVSCSRSLTFRR